MSDYYVVYWVSLARCVSVCVWLCASKYVCKSSATSPVRNTTATNSALVSSHTVSIDRLLAASMRRQQRARFVCRKQLCAIAKKMQENTIYLSSAPVVQRSLVRAREAPCRSTITFQAGQTSGSHQAVWLLGNWAIAFQYSVREHAFLSFSPKSLLVEFCAFFQAFCFPYETKIPKLLLHCTSNVPLSFPTSDLRPQLPTRLFSPISILAEGELYTVALKARRLRRRQNGPFPTSNGRR